MSRSLGNLQELAGGDNGIWCVAARVELHEGESVHFFSTDEGHVAVSVKTQLHGVPIHALLKGGDDDGSGYWKIPSIGTEVFVGFDNGIFEGTAYLISAHGNNPPADIDGSKVYLLGDNVILGDESGAEPPVKADSFASALADFLDKFQTAWNLILTIAPIAAGIATMTTDQKAKLALFSVLPDGASTDAFALFEGATGDYSAQKVVVK